MCPISEPTLAVTCLGDLLVRPLCLPVILDRDGYAPITSPILAHFWMFPATLLCILVTCTMSSPNSALRALSSPRTRQPLLAPNSCQQQSHKSSWTAFCKGSQMVSQLSCPKSLTGSARDWPVPINLILPLDSCPSTNPLSRRTPPPGPSQRLFRAASAYSVPPGSRKPAEQRTWIPGHLFRDQPPGLHIHPA